MMDDRTREEIALDALVELPDLLAALTQEMEKIGNVLEKIEERCLEVIHRDFDGDSYLYVKRKGD